MKIDIVTLFPKMFSGPFSESIIRRAQKEKFVEITIHDLRKFGLGLRKTVDGRIYGGGAGMLLRVDVIAKALEELKSQNSKVVLLDAGGEKFTQKKAQSYSNLEHLILLCGHYEGIDYRVHENLVDEIISIGDYVLTGGEIPAMVITDAITRLIPGVLSKEEATQIESFSEENLIEFPQYTRPEDFNGHKVPQVLLSGNHQEIDKWRQEKAKELTRKNRPDLVK